MDQQAESEEEALTQRLVWQGGKYTTEKQYISPLEFYLVQPSYAKIPILFCILYCIRLHFSTLFYSGDD